MKNINIGTTQTRNIGGYRPSIITGESFNLDRITYDRFLSHVNEVTELLYLNLSRGNRLPAVVSSRIVFTDDSIKVTNPEEISDYSVVLDGTDIDYLRFFVDPSLAELTDITPIAFANSSDYFFYLFVNNIQKTDDTCYCDVYIKELLSGGLTNIAADSTLLDNYYFDLIFLFQSNLEYADQTFQVVSAPFLEDSSHAVTFETIYLYANSFCYIDETTKVECPVKAQLRVRKYLQDTTSFSGDFILGEESSEYNQTVSSSIGGLDSGTYYGIWYYLDSSLGPNTDSFIYYGLTKTNASGGRAPVQPEMPE